MHHRYINILLCDAPPDLLGSGVVRVGGVPTCVGGVGQGRRRGISGGVGAGVVRERIVTIRGSRDADLFRAVVDKTLVLVRDIDSQFADGDLDRRTRAGAFIERHGDGVVCNDQFVYVAVHDREFIFVVDQLLRRAVAVMRDDFYVRRIERLVCGVCRLEVALDGQTFDFTVKRFEFYAAGLGLIVVGIWRPCPIIAVRARNQRRVGIVPGDFSLDRGAATVHSRCRDLRHGVAGIEIGRHFRGDRDGRLCDLVDEVFAQSKGLRHAVHDDRAGRIYRAVFDEISAAVVCRGSIAAQRILVVTESLGAGVGGRARAVSRPRVDRGAADVERRGLHRSPVIDFGTAIGGVCRRDRIVVLDIVGAGAHLVQTCRNTCIIAVCHDRRLYPSQPSSFCDLFRYLRVAHRGHIAVLVDLADGVGDVARSVGQRECDFTVVCKRCVLDLGGIGHKAVQPRVVTCQKRSMIIPVAQPGAAIAGDRIAKIDVLSAAYSFCCLQPFVDIISNQNASAVIHAFIVLICCCIVTIKHAGECTAGIEDQIVDCEFTRIQNAEKRTDTSVIISPRTARRRCVCRHFCTVCGVVFDIFHCQIAVMTVFVGLN